MAKVYQIGVVGEANYQAAIRQCAVGQRVEIVHEPDNPYDDLALAVSANGRTIGYVARDCWLRDAVHEEGHGCGAVVKRINEGGRGLLGVVLDVWLTDADLTERPFERAATPREKSPPEIQTSAGWLARLFRP